MRHIATRRAAAVLAALALAACGAADRDERDPTPRAVPATTADTAGWEQFDYANATVPLAALRPLPLAELQRVRAVIFGRHGRVFQDTTIQRWLAARPWYRADTTFTNERLSARERANLDLVREAEASKHEHIEPGDMRFYQQRVITSAMLGTHTPQDWDVLKAEVLANHGYVFEGDPEESVATMYVSELQQYFDERYWYRRNGDFSASGLGAIERQNLDTITIAMMRQLGRRVSPGMMHLFQTHPLEAALLEHVPIADLRVLRNEVYARHGRPFRTDWLRDRFRAEPWYEERPEFTEAELTAVDRANIALITGRERRLHDELGSRLLTVADVMGLPNEDARRLRNEIYARHGRRFRDPRLQRYFESFDWYRPDDAFRESALNATERANSDLISQYEDGRFTEG